MAAERILVVDDDECIRMIVRMCLTDEGYEVREATNGQTALDMVEEFQPSLILLDLRMPVMDGREFARRYRASQPQPAPVVAFVAARDADEECVGLESAAIVTKPFDLDDLLGAVRTQLPLGAT